MAYKALPDPELLRKLLVCDPDAGTLTWLPRLECDFKTRSAFVQWNTRNAGKPAFVSRKYGYLSGTINGNHFYTHRVIWAMVHNVTKIDELDHINGNRTDNRICNLREVGRLINTQNRKLRNDCPHGVHGVEFHVSKKWKAYINVNKRRAYLGLYDTLEEAKAARKAAEVKYGYHPNHGRET